MNNITDELLLDGPEEISALFLHLASDSLLVPMAAVAEVTNEDMEIIPLDEPDDRFYGSISWRGLQLLLLSFEALSGGRREALSTESQVVILNAIGPGKTRGFYGLVVQGYPQRVNIVDTEEAQPIARQSRVPGALYEVVVVGQLALIPDFDFLETLCAEVRLPSLASAST
ncbi:MAG: chemotaxis protein CheW [Porticoccaceae bacterium]|nr:chemotaxis protein CheW [Porticoccaceae bacterium]